MVISNINNVNKTYSYGMGKNGAGRDFMPELPYVNNVSFKGDTCTQKALTWISKNFSSPQQRAVLGITALCTQPFIDLYNRHIKKEDKPVTVARTIAKILVGTTIGVLMRHYTIKAVNKFANIKNTGKYSQCLLPKFVIEKLKANPNAVPKDLADSINNYIKGFGTFIGTMGGLFTNFTIDAPMSKKVTNLIHEKVFKKEKSNGQ